MNMTYVGLELKRFFRDFTGVFFIAVLPCFFYVVFGAVQSYSAQSIGNGNVAMYVMLSMASYGAVTATVSIGGSAAMERMQGWGRQLGLTPLRDSAFVATKALVAMLVAVIPIGLIFIIAGLTGASGTVAAWVVGGIVALLGAAVFSIYGLIFGLSFRSESAIGAASGSLVVLAFIGNLFFPLSGALLTISKFTPLYGYVALARRALTGGHILDGTAEGNLLHEPIWQELVNFGVWTAIFVTLAIWAVRRGRRRQ